MTEKNITLKDVIELDNKPVIELEDHIVDGNKTIEDNKVDLSEKPIEEDYQEIDINSFGFKMLPIDDGLKSIGAFQKVVNCFSAYAINYYFNDYKNFFKAVSKEADPKLRDETLKHVVNGVDYTEETLIYLLSFFKDKNDVPYSRESVNNLKLAEIQKMLFCLYKKYVTEIDLFF